MNRRSTVFVSNPKDREYFSFRDVDVRILRCDGCGSLFQDPFPTANELSTLYPENYQDYTKSNVPLIGDIFLAQQRKAAKAFQERHGRESAVLDFGCGPGFFLKLLSEMGSSSLVGFDFGAYRDTGGAFEFYTSLEAIKADGWRFDVIRMNHVIEHLADLDQTICQLANLLKPKGTIIGQTPNAAHITAKLFKGYWGALHYPYHTVLFSPASLNLAAKRWELDCGPCLPSFMPTGWAMSIENLLKGFSGSKSIGRSLVYPLLLGSAIPFVMVDQIRGDSAVFDFTLTVPT